MDKSLVQQLEALYAERESLEAAIGTSDAEGIIAMVSSLDAQLRSLYADLEADEVLAGPRLDRMIAARFHELAASQGASRMELRGEHEGVRWKLVCDRDG